MVGPFALVSSLVTMAHPGIAQGQSQNPPLPAAVTAAQAALRAGAVDSAIAGLEAYFVANPTATTGRLLLGTAYRRRGDFDRALATLLAITQPRPMRLQALFAAAGILAIRGQVDSSLALLAQLKRSGAFDVELARTANDFAALLTHPRFEASMFRLEDFVEPFVEPVQILRELRGETRGDQFGWIARRIGDVDGDSVHELVTSAPSFRAGAPLASGAPSAKGRVYVYSGRTGALLWTHTGEDGEGLGTGLEGAGDVNADGIGDVIAGAPGADRAYVYSGRDGALLRTLSSATRGERFGSAVSSAGDQNGDGVDDVVVGAPASNFTAEGAGRVYVFSGASGALLFTVNGTRAGEAFGSIVAGARGTRGAPVVIGAPGAGTFAAGQQPRGQVVVYERASERVKFVIDADSTGGALGAMFASLVGDVNGDRVLDVYASDFADGAHGPSTGRAFVYSGANGSRLLRLTGERAGDGFGIGSADVGDVNRDGFDDLAIGAWQYSRTVASAGRVYVYSGKDGALLRTVTGRIPGETLGFDATGIGDVNGDGVIDLLVTSSWSNVNGFQSGRLFIISGVVPR